MDPKTEEKLEQIRNIVSDATECGEAALQHGSEILGEQVRSINSAAGEKLSLARAQAEKAAANTSKIVSSHPLSAVAAAVAIGAFAAWALPKKAKAAKPENTSGGKAEKLKAASNKAGKKAAEKAKTVIRDAGDLMGQAGEAARKAPGAIADTASDVAARLSEKMQDIAAASKKKG
ncbi:MAG: hypothetical protein E2598_07095 [Sphingobium sp.]|nr:hypothetical protein [Sphingobium sp.]